MKYDKLIRDKIPSFIKKNFIMKIADEEELLQYIEKKVSEEIKEFKLDPSIHEAVDIIEILDKLFKYHLGLSIYSKEIKKARNEKIEKRGSFNKNLVLVEVKDDETTE